MALDNCGLLLYPSPAAAHLCCCLWCCFLLLCASGLPHNDIAAQICRQAGLVKHPDGSKGHGHGTADLLGVEDGQVGD
jgi:hypothetical protein